MKKYPTCYVFTAKWLLLSGIAFIGSLNAQNLDFHKHSFSWSTPSPEPLPVAAQFQSEDAVILKEELRYFIPTRNTKRYLRVKFLTEKGVRRFSEWSLPQSTDPTYDESFIAVEKKSEVHQPKGTYDYMVYFAARIIRPDGTVKKAIVSERIEKELIYIGGGTFTVYAYHFKINDLQVNDELEIEYMHKDEDNLLDQYNGITSIEALKSGRFFFHSNIAKQQYKLTIVYESHLKYIFSYPNTTSPDDSISSGAPDYLTELTWKRENLPACTDEAGSLLYKDLPHVRFYEHDKKFGIRNPKTNFIEIFTPYTWLYAVLKLVDYKRKHEQYLFDKKDSETVAISKLYKDLSSVPGDSLTIHKLYRIHETFNDNFEYQDDRAFYAGEDVRLERVKEFLDNRVLREISRNNLYSEILNRLGEDYYLARFTDKRINELDQRQFFPSLKGSHYYCVSYKGQPFYLIPKSHRFGYHINEFPFYYEGIPVVLIPRRLSEDDYREFKGLGVSFTTTPESQATDNVRNSNVMVKVSLDSLRTDFNAKLSLDGQFSTLSRGYYQYGYIDTTVNPKYHQRICDLGPGGKTGKLTITNNSSYFPFNFKADLAYTYPNLVTKKSDSIYQVNLSNWFNHVIYPDFSADKRDLPFYPDFSFKDSYRYYLKFDHHITAENLLDTVRIENRFGTYVFTISQPYPDIVMLESYFTVSVPQVPAKQTGDVEAIYSAIQKLNSSRLIVKIKS